MFVQKPLTCVEICAGAGGQALGLAMAGFVHVALVEYEADYCNTLKQNRPEWNVICADVRNFDGKPYEGVDLLAGGVPCPPFSIAGKQLGKDDERDLFPEALRLIKEIKPRAVMLENVRGFLDNGFSEYRQYILKSIEKLQYQVDKVWYDATIKNKSIIDNAVVIDIHIPVVPYSKHTITGIQIISIEGIVAGSKEVSISRDITQGVFMQFKFPIKEVDSDV